MKSYKDLKIYNEAFDLSVRIRKLTMQMAHPDRYEVGSQIRRSSQSIKDNIVEGYGRKKYKKDFIKHLIYAHASLLEAKSQADFIFAVNKNKDWISIKMDLDRLGIKLHNFISYVEQNWVS